MKYVLARGQRELVERFAASPTLLALDFDGTLAPIVADRTAATMRPETTRLLREVALRYPVAVLSGRGRTDLVARLGGAQVRWIVGNHGIEHEDDAAGRASPFAAVVRAARERLASLLADAPGIEIEDKRLSLALHYRKATDKDAARAAIAGATEASWPDARVVGGKQVVNLLPPGAPHKGNALDALRLQAGVKTAIYVGDDVTDEDVFVQDEPDRLLCVRVQKSSRTAAPYYLCDQTEMDAFLTLLSELRRPS